MRIYSITVSKKCKFQLIQISETRENLQVGDLTQHDSTNKTLILI